MMKKYKLGDLVEVSRGASLSGNYYATSGNYIRLTCGNFDYHNNCFKENYSKDNLFYTGDFKDDFLLEKGDLITPLTEQAIGLLGSTAWIPESGKYIQSQDIAKITCKEELLDKKFAYYLFSSNMVKQQLSAAAQQTKIRHTSPDKIKDCTVWIPSLSEQTQTGQLLFDIDCKMEINRAINHNLEAMAKQLYDYWFVQFDFPDENGKPYKSSGGKMVWNEVLKKYVPEGWEIASLRDIVDLEDSKRVPLSNAQRAGRKGNYPYYGATGIMDYIDDFIFDYDILLLAEDGSTSDANGFPVVQYVWGKVWVNNHAHIILPKDRDHLVYTYFLLKGIPIKLIETGSIQKKISQDNLLVYKTLNAPKYIRDIYTERMSALWEQKKLATEEIMQLTKQRDELLPLLMNGQASVNYDLSHD
ncbi:Predicted nucleotidyltransferases [Porphyromonas macacae]|uniref:Predicted nucleotidyltransferases n=3 Tax=Porphyromonas macacae TaxID=28115 RepID=A0A379EGX5_9PORP|nr:restriction endonuclease subunit S [Porphyromonas macacae]SUB98054.1 Predicted nucleotidyltransferases [Porphyromonas macacae]